MQIRKQLSLFAVAALLMATVSFGATAAFAQDAGTGTDTATRVETRTDTETGTAAGTGTAADTGTMEYQTGAYGAETAGTEQYGGTMADTGANPLAFVAAGFALCGVALLLMYRGRKSAIHEA